MKILKLEHFRELPAGALFSLYTPFAFGNLLIKSNDPELPLGEAFRASHISDAIAHTSTEDAQKRLDDALLFGESFGMDFGMEYEHPTDAEQLFAVWEVQDVMALVNRLAPDLTQTLLRQHMLLKRAAAALKHWHASHGIISPLYIPPGGDVDLPGDIAKELEP